MYLLYVNKQPPPELTLTLPRAFVRRRSSPSRLAMQCKNDAQPRGRESISGESTAWRMRTVSWELMTLCGSQ
jgi:hypothetical protein